MQGVRKTIGVTLTILFVYAALHRLLCNSDVTPLRLERQLAEHVVTTNRKATAMRHHSMNEHVNKTNCYLRPNSVHLYRNTWHWIEHDDVRAAFLSVHFDDRRIKTRYDQLRFTMSSSVKLANSVLQTLVWYKDRPCAIEIACSYALEEDNFVVGNSSINRIFMHKSYAVTCTLPSLDGSSTPDKISIKARESNGTQHLTLTNLALILRPLPFLPEYTDSFGVCASNLYGKFTLNDTYLFINWMESLLMFGVKEVTMNNLSLSVEHTLTARMFEHYTGSGVLKLQNYSTLMPDLTIKPRFTNRGDDLGAQNAVINKCLHDNRLRYWFALVLDWDEILVPQTGDLSYKIFFKKLANSQQLSNFKSIKNFMPTSIYFYRNRLEHNNQQPPFLPMLQPKQAFESEFKSKSFQNPRLCGFAGIHKCDMFSGWRDYVALKKDQMLKHHYRSKCKYPWLCNSELTNENKLYTTYGQRLRGRVESVLRALGHNV